MVLDVFYFLRGTSKAVYNQTANHFSSPVPVVFVPGSLHYSRITSSLTGFSGVNSPPVFYTQKSSRWLSAASLILIT
jgi:hypothetical protein